MTQRSLCATRYWHSHSKFTLSFTDSLATFRITILVKGQTQALSLCLSRPCHCCLVQLVHFPFKVKRCMQWISDNIVLGNIFFQNVLMLIYYTDFSDPIFLLSNDGSYKYFQSHDNIFSLIVNIPIFFWTVNNTYLSTD